MTFRLLAKMVQPSTRTSLFYAALFSAIVAVGPAATPVAAASAPPSSDQVQLFGVHPLHQGQTTLPGGHFNFALIPGESISDGVVVENFSSQSLDFQVYGADLLTVSGGGYAPAQPTDPMHDAGAWIVISVPHVTIPAHSQFTDRFTLTLPPGISPGEHRGAVVAAAIVGKTPEGSKIEARTALITLVTVPGTERPSGSLGTLGRSAAGSPELGFDITLSNTGNLLLTYAGSVEIDDSDGHRVATLPLTPADAYVVPGGHIALAATWKEPIPQSGSYRARATVTILAKGKPVATLTSQSLELPFSSSFPLLPVVVIVLSALFGPAAIWQVRRGMRRRRRSHPAMTSA